MLAVSGLGPPAAGGRLARILRKDRGHRVLDLLFGLCARRAHQVLVHRGVPQRLLGLAVVDVYADNTFLIDIGVIPAPPAAVPAVAPADTAAPTPPAVAVGTAFDDVSRADPVPNQAIGVLRRRVDTSGGQIRLYGRAQPRLVHRVGDRAAQGIAAAMEGARPVERLALHRASQRLI